MYFFMNLNFGFIESYFTKLLKKMLYGIKTYSIRQPYNTILRLSY